jgi:hypothetical protein
MCAKQCEHVAFLRDVSHERRTVTPKRGAGNAHHCPTGGYVSFDRGSSDYAIATS